MSIQVENEQATVEEATGILLERLPASKVARLLAAWRVGQGDCLAGREKLFAGETVDSLFDKAKAANGGKRPNPLPGSAGGPHFCSMKITEDVRKYAAEQGIAEEEALKKGMEEKSKEFVSQGTEVYVK